jgi:tRNA (mo5U34)-methyltransferase
VSEHPWYHTIDLPDGTTTPGLVDTRRARAFIEWPSGLRGGRCLDVGTFDGFWAFEMERLGGAEIVGLDVDDPEALDWSFDARRSGPAALRDRGSLRGRGFARVAEALGSSAKRVTGSVYDLDPEVHGLFDVVSFGALLLPLRDPVLALERVRDVCAGELVLIEALDPTLELAAPRVPCARFAPSWNMWWRVNTAGMLAIIDRAGFEATWVGRRFVVPMGATARRGPRPPLINSLAARDLRHRGGVHRAFRARPRPSRGG